MSCIDQIQTLPGRYTAGDLEDPIQVIWNEEVTTETSELIIDRPSGGSVTLTGTLLDADTGQFEYPWTAGALVAGEGQLCKARLFRSGSRRKSTVYFKINVDEDIS
jgi:hypothetical protein